VWWLNIGIIRRSGKDFLEGSVGGVQGEVSGLAGCHLARRLAQASMTCARPDSPTTGQRIFSMVLRKQLLQ
jgi:hypothetical protein